MSTEPQSFAPEFPGTPTIKRTDRLMLAVLIFGAFSALVSSYILLHVHVQQQKNLVVGVDFGSGSGLYEFVIASKTGKPSLIPYLLSTPDNKTLHVIDTVSVKEGTYYLLQEDAETANVYQSTEKGLVKITNTKSFKRNLSYDAVSETLAYESSAKASPSTTAWYIYLFSIKEKKEANTQITSLQSQLTTGGTGLFVVSSSSVDYVALPSGVSTSVLHLI